MAEEGRNGMIPTGDDIIQLVCEKKEVVYLTSSGRTLLASTSTSVSVLPPENSIALSSTSSSEAPELTSEMSNWLQVPSSSTHRCAPAFNLKHLVDVIAQYTSSRQRMGTNEENEVIDESSHVNGNRIPCEGSARSVDTNSSDLQSSSSTSNALVAFGRGRALLRSIGFDVDSTVGRGAIPKHPETQMVPAEIHERFTHNACRDVATTEDRNSVGDSSANAVSFKQPLFHGSKVLYDARSTNDRRLLTASSNTVYRPVNCRDPASRRFLEYFDGNVPGTEAYNIVQERRQQYRRERGYVDYEDTTNDPSIRYRIIFEEMKGPASAWDQSPMAAEHLAERHLRKFFTVGPCRRYVVEVFKPRLHVGEHVMYDPTEDYIGSAVAREKSSFLVHPPPRVLIVEVIHHMRFCVVPRSWTSKVAKCVVAKLPIAQVITTFLVILQRACDYTEVPVDFLGTVDLHFAPPPAQKVVRLSQCCSSRFLLAVQHESVWSVFVVTTAARQIVWISSSPASSDISSAWIRPWLTPALGLDVSQYSIFPQVTIYYPAELQVFPLLDQARSFLLDVPPLWLHRRGEELAALIQHEIFLKRFLRLPPYLQPLRDRAPHHVEHPDREFDDV